MAVQTGMVNIGTAAQLPAYLAQPEGKGPFPAVLGIFETFGLNENSKDLNRRFPETGYVALALADKIRCPMIVNFGEKDAFMPLDEVRKIEARLKELGKQAEVTVYPGADHGYMCSDRASYHAQAAKESWEKMVAFFGKHLK